MINIPVYDLNLMFKDIARCNFHTFIYLYTTYEPNPSTTQYLILTILGENFFFKKWEKEKMLVSNICSFFQNVSKTKKHYWDIFNL